MEGMPWRSSVGAILSSSGARGESYVANDVALDRDHHQILMITGPNMSGKSALLRQTALIALMAQMGGYVPARSVRMGLVDKVFTRVGASDNLSAGESTFMVEMNETASILHNLSTAARPARRDRPGHQHLRRHQHRLGHRRVPARAPEGRARRCSPRITTNSTAWRTGPDHNANVSVRQQDGKVLFLRKLMPGGSEHLRHHVAKLAGMPASSAVPRRCWKA